MLAGWLSAFRSYFSALVWSRVLVLVAGAVLAPGKWTVCRALRHRPGAGLGFSRCHEALSRARWNGWAVAHALLARVLNALLPAGEVAGLFNAAGSAGLSLSDNRRSPK